MILQYVCVNTSAFSSQFGLNKGIVPMLTLLNPGIDVFLPLFTDTFKSVRLMDE